MFLRQRSSGHIVAVVDPEQLFSIFHDKILARDQVGEEEQDPEPIAKSDLVFLSGEPLPRCWTDPDYRER
ncbi:acetyltransferase [Parahaliea mediterranea]|uniref:Acetyltransferase n=1 Tax=Parahaliea mediterranea TaxID=651086 RepID=A0A939IP52_9GAMM|nr:acetyltransferase [Parahaliea mediterranea]MBN7798707.1 acetyltransferase [Parahaliea mediterranea]